MNHRLVSRITDKRVWLTGLLLGALLFAGIPALRAQEPIADIDFDVIINGGLATAVVMNDSGEVYIAANGVTKFNADGTIGFSGPVGGEALALDQSGNVFVAGIDATTGSQQAFVAKLSADGSRLMYRTALGPAGGGAGMTGAGPYPRLSIAVDASGNAHVGGTALPGSTSMPVGNTVHGRSDGFVAKVDSDGALMSKTFLGGAGGDTVTGIVVDDQMNVTVTGGTDSADFPVTGITHAQPDGGEGAFVTSFAADGTIRYSTYFGSNSRGLDIARGVSDGPPAFGGVWVTGTTSQWYYPGIDVTPFPATADAYGDFTTEYQNTHRQTFVMHVSDTGQLLYSTSLVRPGYDPRDDEGGGEHGSDRAISIAVNDHQKRTNTVYVVGESNAHINFYNSEDDGFGFQFDFGPNSPGGFDAGIRGNYEDATYDVGLNRRGDTVSVGFTTSYSTALEYMMDRSPTTRIYGRNLALEPYDPETMDYIEPAIIIRKRRAPDSDGDRVPNHLDNCRTVVNADQSDADSDGIGDACEIPDTDGDGRIDTLDNCSAVRNPDQADQDGDAVGDACDTDRDGDGIANRADTCAVVPNPDQADADGDRIGDVCDPNSVAPPYSNQLTLVGTAAGPGGGATRFSVNTATNIVYALTAGRSLRAIDGATAEIKANIAVPFYADSIAADSVGNRVFVNDVNTATVHVLDGTTLAERTSVALSNASAAPVVAVNSSTKQLYAGGSGIQVFDAETLAPVKMIQANLYVRRIWVDEARNVLYFANDFGQVGRYDGATQQTSLVEGTESVQVLDVAADRAIWRDENGTSATIKDLILGSVAVAPTELQYVGGLDTNAAAKRVYAFGPPQYLFDGTTLFGPGPLDLYMFGLDGAVLGRFDVPGEGVDAIMANPATGFVYAADHRGNVHVIRDAGAVPPPNTPPGADVTVAPPDAGGATVTFENVTGPGKTTVVPLDLTEVNLTLPGGFSISDTSAAFEISTTATISGRIEVCLVADPNMPAGDFATASILHGVNGAWQVETTRRDPATRRLCADVTSFSPFAVGVLDDTAPPQISCEQPATAWQTANVSLRCTAVDAGAGLAVPGDASFALTTSVASGQELASAATSAHEVCDLLGHCATAGPIGGIRIDLRAPSVQVTAPAAQRYVIGATLTANYSCADAGSGVASCAGPVANGAALDTTTIASRSFAVAASDAAGNTSAASVDYTVGYGLKPLFSQTSAFRAGSTVSFQLQLVNASGANLSSPGVVVTARRITRVGTGSALPLNITVPYDAKSKSYGGKVNTKGLAAGIYEIELVAGADPFVHKVRITLN